MSGGKKMKFTKEQCINLYRMMVQIRAFEEMVSTKFAAGCMPGFVHLSLGQEAVAAGACGPLRKDDYIITNHRGHGHCIAKGVDMKPMMAELYGKKTGLCKGKSGSMHLSDMEHGMLGANAIVGAGIPIGTGAAYSIKVRKTDQVVVIFHGEGSTGNGVFHESMNMAAIWKLPAIYCCENNLYAEMTHASVHMPFENVADRAKGYNIPSAIVDGNDPEAVYQAVDEAVKRARKGEGPTFIECKTYRWHGHYEGDPAKYRKEGELEEWMKKEPIKVYGEKLKKLGYVKDADLEQIAREAQAMVDEAVKFAEESPAPGPEVILEDLYA
jgi:pyruvate dehydrogenase E1 component alpha subunit